MSNILSSGNENNADKTLSFGANQVLLMALIFTVVVGILISIAAVVFAEPIIRFCGANEDTQESAVLYFRIIMGGMIFNIISMAINASRS